MPADEVSRLEAQLSRLIEEARTNHDLLLRSRRREFELLNADNLPSLFERLTLGLGASFGLEHVSVLLCDPDHEVRHLLMAAGTTPEGLRNVDFVDALIGIAPQFAMLRQPWLGPYSAADHQLVFGRGSEEGLGSIALIPLVRQGRLMGSLNLGSADPARYTGEHGTEFLAHLGVIASFALENAVNRARLLRSGATDILTGWYSRQHLERRLREELARSRRESVPVAVVRIDVDHFRRINDTHGHLTGDRVLAEVAQRLETEIRASDVAARCGGAQLVLLLPNTDAGDAAILAERLRRAIAGEPLELEDGVRLPLTVSAGVAATYPDRGDADLKTMGESLLARAEVALRDAKAAGRDRVATARPA